MSEMDEAEIQRLVGEFKNARPKPQEKSFLFPAGTRDPSNPGGRPLSSPNDGQSSDAEEVQAIAEFEKFLRGLVAANKTSADPKEEDVDLPARKETSEVPDWIRQRNEQARGLGMNPNNSRRMMLGANRKQRDDEGTPGAMDWLQSAGRAAAENKQNRPAMQKSKKSIDDWHDQQVVNKEIQQDLAGRAANPPPSATPRPRPDAAPEWHTQFPAKKYRDDPNEDEGY